MSGATVVKIPTQPKKNGTAKRIVLTPEMAVELLEHNTNNSSCTPSRPSGHGGDETMSLDVYLSSADARDEPERWAIFIREDGAQKEITLEEWNRRFADKGPPVLCKVGGETSELYSRNITHNLGKMADAAGVYDCMWRPDEHGITHAKQLIEPLTLGLKRLRSDPDHFKVHNPSNGWGDYEGLVAFVADYLAACERHPDAIVYASR